MRKIPFSPPDIGEEEIIAVEEVLRSGWITTGPKTKEFERQIADYCNTKRAVCLNSATAAMELTLRLLGIGEGDEVITSAYTYSASASVIDHIGAKIVLADTKENSFEIDPEDISKKITDKTKAIIPVDIAGVICDYDSIYKVLEEKKELFVPNSELQEKLGRIAIIADGAHAFGGEQKGKKAGEISDFTCFSFHAVKNLTTAEGGAVTWNIDGIDNEEIYTNFMLLSLHGQNRDALAKTKAGSWEYDIVAPYYKYNMTDIASAIGLVQLSRYKDLLERRHQIMELYYEKTKDLDIEIISHSSEDFKSSAHLCLIRINGADEKRRNEIIINLENKGISVNVHYKPLPLLSAYKNLGFDIKDYPNAFEMYKNEITLPLHTLLSDDDIEYIVDGLREVLDG